MVFNIDFAGGVGVRFFRCFEGGQVWAGPSRRVVALRSQSCALALWLHYCRK